MPHTDRQTDMATYWPTRPSGAELVKNSFLLDIFKTKGGVSNQIPKVLRCLRFLPYLTCESYFMGVQNRVGGWGSRLAVYSGCCVLHYWV